MLQQYIYGLISNLFIGSILLSIIMNIFIYPEYRKFYFHPAVGIILTAQDSNNYNEKELKFLTIGYVFIYILIAPFWLVLWALYKGVMFLIKKLFKLQPKYEHCHKYNLYEYDEEYFEGDPL